MRKILAIAAIAVRNAIRSRVVASLLFVLAVAMVGLPLTLKGDGTPEGQVQILINYTMGFTALILSLASLWAGCAAVSTEIAEKQMQMVSTKPVHALQVWLGKWLGLMAVNGVLLCVAAGTAYGLLHWRTGPGQFPEGERARLHREVLTARQAIQPVAPDIEPEALRRYRELQLRGELATNAPPAAVMEALREQIRVQINTVPPGFAKRWEYRVPPGPPDRSISLSFRFVSSRLGPSSIEGLWIAGPSDLPNKYQIAATNIAGGVQRIPLPSDVGAAGTVMVEYANMDSNGVSVVFDTAAGPLLRVEAGTFAPNFARAILVLLAHLAFMSALGVTAGSLFSMPVATFLALGFIFVLQVAGFLKEAADQDVLIPWHEGPNRGPNWADAALRLLFRGVHAMASPLKGPDVLAMISSGERVGWLLVVDAALLQVVVAGGLLALVGSFVFSRRELALHTS
jgi:hypothetical protein